jgi:hypothetical protein
MACPCKECTERTITCHGFCERYKDWKDERDKGNEERYKHRENRNTINRTVLRRIWKGMRWK